MGGLPRLRCRFLIFRVSGFGLGSPRDGRGSGCMIGLFKWTILVQDHPFDPLTLSTPGPPCCALRGSAEPEARHSAKGDPLVRRLRAPPHEGGIAMSSVVCIGCSVHADPTGAHPVVICARHMPFVNARRTRQWPPVPRPVGKTRASAADPGLALGLLRPFSKMRASGRRRRWRRRWRWRWRWRVLRRRWRWRWRWRRSAV